jgi:hypothetical protein
MSYNYQTQKPNIFTEDGVKMLTKIRDEAKRLIKISSVVQSDKLIKATSGDTWTMMACMDYLIECGDLLEIPNTLSKAGQHRIFTNFDWQ